MPARDNRFSQVGTSPAGDRVYERTYASSSARDYDSMTKDELQGLLRHMALPVSGTKDELIERLQEAE